MITGATAANASVMELPRDPHADIPLSEKLTYQELERQIHYLARNVEFDLHHGYGEEYAALRLLDLAQTTAQRFDQYSTPTQMRFLNSVMMVFVRDFDFRRPYMEKGRVYDNAGNRQSREFAVRSAKAVALAISKLPPQASVIEIEFPRQHTKSTPARLLESYLRDLKSERQTGRLPFFDGALEETLKERVAEAHHKEGLGWKIMDQFFTRKPSRSCQAAFH